MQKVPYSDTENAPVFNTK